MRFIVKFGISCILFLLACPVLFSASVHDKPLTIFTNPNFPQDYYLTPGQDLPHGNPDLSFHMMNVPGQMGLYDSYEQTILYINILSITGLPAGLSFDQDLNSRRPLSNLLYLFGTIPLDVKQGVYTVTINGQDGAVPTNTANAVIYLHIGTAVPPPVPVAQAPVVSGNVGEHPPVTLPPLNKTLTDYFTNNDAIDAFQIRGDLNPALFGIALVSPDGNFTGIYTQAGSFAVQVAAHNAGGWSTPLTITFNISAPPVAASAGPVVTATIGDAMPVSLPPLNQPVTSYFTSSLPIDNYQLVGGDSPQSFGLQFNATTASFSGNFNQVGNFSALVQAHNSAGWSNSLTVNFIISAVIPPPITTTTLLCPTVSQLGFGLPPQAYSQTDSAGNPYIFALTNESVGFVTSFYGAQIVSSATPGQSGLQCIYLSSSTFGPSITFTVDNLPAQSSIATGNTCFDKSNPTDCVIDITNNS